MSISKGVMNIVWDHLIYYRRLFANGRLHLNCVGEARLGRVLNTKLRMELKSYQMHQEGKNETSNKSEVRKTQVSLVYLSKGVGTNLQVAALDLVRG